MTKPIWRGGAGNHDSDARARSPGRQGTITGATGPVQSVNMAALVEEFLRYSPDIIVFVIFRREHCDYYSLDHCANAAAFLSRESTRALHHVMAYFDEALRTWKEG